MAKIIRWIVVLALVAGLAAGGFWLYQSRSAAQSTTTAQDDTFTQVVAVQQGDLSASISVVGALEADQQATLAFDRLSGVTTLLSLDVAAGNKVEAGQTMASVDPAPWQQALDQARSALQEAEQTLDDLQTPATALQVAQADLAIAKAELAQAQAQDALDELTTPDLVSLRAQVANARLSVTQAQASLLEVQSDKTRADNLDTLRETEADRSAEHTRLANESYTDSYQRDRLRLAYNALRDAQDARISAELQAQVTLLKAQMQVRQTEQKLADAQEGLAEAQSGADALDLAAAQQAVAQAESDVAAAQEARTDLDAGADAVKLAAAQADVDKKRLAVAEAEADLAGATLVAPFSGTVLETQAKAGDRISANSPILTIANMDGLQVVASVDETTIRQIAAGQAAQISFDAFPGQTFSGEVLSVPLQGTLQGGVMVYDVPVSLQGAEALPLLVGMTANVAIDVGQAQNALLVPSMAVQTVGGLAQVLVPNASDPANPVAVPVQVGLSNGTYTEIVRGLNAGDQVVVQLSSASADQFGFGAPGGLGVMMVGGAPSGGLPAGAPPGR
jgi:HlyD family secretion protein